MPGIDTASVVVVGAGPAGLAAAHVLAQQEVGPVLVIDRDDAPGGLPRFCRHPGFGWEYSHRIESGPRFVRRLLKALDGSKVKLMTRTTMLGLSEGPVLHVTGPTTGPVEIQPRAVILATGIREKARGPRLIPGARPEQGIYTTGLLQQMIHRGIAVPSRRMAIVGTEHVAFSALLMVRHLGCRVVAMIEPGPRVLSFALAGFATRNLLRTPILLRTSIAEIIGQRKLEGVVVDGSDGTQRIECDGVVFTSGWVPDAAGLSGSGVEIDTCTGGPIIDQMMRTTVPGVFAAGNLLRPIESSGFAALEGARAGACAAAFVKGSLAGEIGQCVISTAAEFKYVIPQRWSPSEGMALSTWPLRPSLRVVDDRAKGRVAVKASDRILWQSRRGPLLRERRIGLNLPGAFQSWDGHCRAMVMLMP